MIPSLLNALTGRHVAGLCLDYGDGIVRAVPQDTIRLFAGLAASTTANDENATISEGNLLVDTIGAVIPSSQFRDYVRPTGTRCVQHFRPLQEQQ